MTKKSSKAQATAPMFESYADANGVEIYCNAHPASDYGTTAQLTDPSVPLARQVADQVFNISGHRMAFSSPSADPGKPPPPSPSPYSNSTLGWDDMLFPSMLKKGTR